MAIHPLPKRWGTSCQENVKKIKPITLKGVIGFILVHDKDKSGFKCYNSSYEIQKIYKTIKDRK